MGKRFFITEDILRNASDYIPLSRKNLLARSIAEKCIQRSPIAEQNQKGLEFLALPSLWIDDMETKSLYLMSVMLSEYLKAEIPDEFTDAEYDFYASSHIFNQLERFKGYAELKDKVFDILTDFKEFKKILDTEIYNEKIARNDPVGRLSAAISIVSSPENIQRMKEELEKSTGDLQDALSSGKVETKE